ncbi:Uracil phosphoribosyltransferase [Phytophthora citrophthora]|uniref:Uracil phosphoribosyltransferase n=1 Tax=Phytophthora citrophthora TaxID=4793 RepID=A0AAD9LG41_9STRA|nr:Uracil phosphoribosyltransferase [Phytophthora citrophthora]
MFLRTVRGHAKLGAAALLGAPMLLSQQEARAEQRVYASGEALGRGVRLELWKAQHENVVVLDLESELIQLGMTRIRDYENAGAKFTHDANGVLRSALDLALTELPNDEEVKTTFAVVTTPRGYKAEGLVFEDDVKVCGISIAVKPEAQKGLSQVLRTSLPFDSTYGEVLVQQGPKGGNKATTLPEDLDGQEVLILLPEFASISQVDKVIHLLMQEGVDEEKITVVTLVTCPEAADGFCKTFGDARLVTASFDSRLNNEGHIVPGIGSFEERYLGAPSSVVEVIDDPAEDTSDEENGLKAKIASKFSSWFKKD